MKKRYLKKRNELKASKQSGTSADVVEKAEKKFKPYSFLAWIDEHVRIRKSRTNININCNKEADDCIDDGEEGDEGEERETQNILVENDSPTSTDNREVRFKKKESKAVNLKRSALKKEDQEIQEQE